MNFNVWGYKMDKRMRQPAGGGGVVGMGAQ